MKQLSYDLEHFLNQGACGLAQEQFSQQLLSFLHEHTLWHEWLTETGLAVLWQESKVGLLEALTHPTLYHQIERWPVPHNQRLEFLGDAALDFYVTKKILSLYPEQAEGQLSKLRATIVNEEGLAAWARMLKIDQVLLLGKGELKNKTLGDSQLSDALEAIVGALSLSSLPWEELLDEWTQVFNEHSDVLFFSLDRLKDFDPKTTLQEKTLALYKMLPVYEDREKEGQFEVTLSLGSNILATALGTSKKKAKAQAARLCLVNKTYLGLNPHHKTSGV